MFDNINEIFNPEQQQLKTRSMKIPTQQKLKEIQEQQEKHQIKLSKLSLLEEDENEKEDKDDSDYDMEDEDETNKEKKKRAARPKSKFTKEIRFGKINVNKYFIYEKENLNYDFPNYNNIIVKPTMTKPLHKICDVCFGFANYTCKHCQDKFCSIECYKTHKETQCIKFLDV